MELSFPAKPIIVVYDIGLSPLECAELRRTQGVILRQMPAFVPHWRQNWSWKLHALTYDLPRYVLYLDLPNFVALRSLAHWFLSIKRNGYFVVANGQRLVDITPSDYWAIYGLDRKRFEQSPTFGAGIIGFDRHSPSFGAIQHAFEGVRQGLNLGRSVTEKNANYRSKIIRDCDCFRADQTLLNLGFRRLFGESLQVRTAVRYCGKGGPRDHPKQYLWYARRSNSDSLRHVFEAHSNTSFIRSTNRFIWSTRFRMARILKRILRR
jgi:hypothetical protein